MILAIPFVSARTFNDPVSFEEETIEDIPFDTETIYQNWLAHSMNFDFVDEPFVNDMPFNTSLISEEYKYQQALKQVFLFEDEDTVDDFPFNTEVETTTNEKP